MGSLTTNSDTRAAAEAMRDELRITVAGRLKHRTPQKALSACIASAESAGVLVIRMLGVRSPMPRGVANLPGTHRFHSPAATSIEPHSLDSANPSRGP